MKFAYLAVLFLLAVVVALSGCTLPGASPSPSPSPSPTAIPTEVPIPTATPAPTPTPAPTITPTPAPTPWPVYTNGSLVSVSHVVINYDTAQFTGSLAKQTATMTVTNTLNDSILMDVNVVYTVSTPTTIVDADGTTHNITNHVTASKYIGVMQSGEQRDLTFEVEHARNVPATVSVTVQWRGGSAVAFWKALDIPDHSVGSYEF